MKKVLFGFALVTSCLVLGQKVKLKDGSVLIDKVEVYKYNDEGGTTVSSLSNKELFVIKPNFYEVPNPAYGTVGCPASNCQKMIRRSFITFRFLDNGEEFFSDLSVKDIIKNFHSLNILKEDGTYDDEKRNLFINKFSDDNLRYKLLK